LKEYYGVNLENSWNRKVTESWDNAQTQVSTALWYIAVLGGA